MDFSLTAADEAVRNAARDFAVREIAPLARRADESGTFVGSLVPRLGAEGFLAGYLPEELGGRGWTNLQWTLAQIELGAADSSWRGFCTVQGALCGHLLLDHAPDEIKYRHLPELARGKAIFAYALTEPEAGTDVASLKTRAEPDEEGFRIFGEKIWITNGGVADQVLVFANADPFAGRKGITCFLVPGDAEGLQRSPMDGIELGHRGADHARLVFDGVRVPKEAIVGGLGNGFKVAMGGLDHGRLGVAAGAVGIQMACLEASLAFARTRRQFGQRIGDFQLIQAALTDMHVRLESTRLLALLAASAADRGVPNTLEVSTAKYAACEAAVESADEAVLLHGGRGYSSAFPVERYLRDAKGLQIYEGTAHVQRLIIGRRLVGKDEGPRA